eukprot:gene25775-11441_t
MADATGVAAETSGCSSSAASATGEQNGPNSKNNTSKDLPAAAAHISVLIQPSSGSSSIEGSRTGRLPPLPKEFDVEAVEKEAPADMVYGLTLDQVPEYLHHPYVKNGYRYGGTHKQCMLSLFCMHNETVNTWTMIACMIVSTALFTYAMAKFDLENGEIAAFLAIWLSAIIHNPFSICYHMFTPISDKTYNRWRKADTVLICACSVLLNFSLTYYVCDEIWQVALIIGLHAVVSGYSIYKLLSLPDGLPLDKIAQAFRLAIICLIYWAPMVWQTVREIIEGNPSWGLTFALTLVVILCLSSSGFIYAYSFPERFAPEGMFDTVGNSHQLMHVLVIFAHVAEYIFLFHMHKEGRPAFYE